MCRVEELRSLNKFCKFDVQRDYASTTSMLEWQVRLRGYNEFRENARRRTVITRRDTYVRPTGLLSRPITHSYVVVIKVLSNSRRGRKNLATICLREGIKCS